MQTASERAYLLARCLRLEREIGFLRQGRKTGRRLVTPEERAQWQAWRAAGRTCRAIAKEAGRPEATVSKHTR